jgi:hypothetical protein
MTSGTKAMTVIQDAGDHGAAAMIKLRALLQVSPYL